MSERIGRGDDAFETLARMTAHLASTASLDELSDAVLDQIVALGFGAAWVAVLDESTGHLRTVREVIDGSDTTTEMPDIFMLDTRQPIGHGFRERRMINVKAPDSLLIIEDEEEPIPSGRLALPRVIYDHLRGHPFACGPVIGSRGQPVGAVGLSSYRGAQPIPDWLFERGLLRAFLDHLGIGMERALYVTRIERVNAELVRAQEVIESNARVRAVGELASAVAHDLNNLSGIAMMAVSVGQRSPGAALDALPRIERTCQAIGDLVGRLQRVAHTTSQDDTAHMADVAQVIDDVLLMLAPVCREESIEVDVDLRCRDEVACDPGLLHQIVTNLILNAREALAEVSPDSRSLRVSVDVDDGGVVIGVADSGPGIPDELRERMFQAFVTTKGRDHPGLGLATIQSVLKHVGGQVRARNGDGGGALFEVTLPRADRPDESVEESAAERAPSHLSILVVDDEQDVIDVVRDFLEPAGHAVAAAPDAKTAMALADSRRFDLVLCDLGMPVESGMSLARKLHERGHTAKFAIMTGWDLRAESATPELDAVLHKPFTGRSLDALLDQLFPQHGG